MRTHIAICCALVAGGALGSVSQAQQVPAMPKAIKTYLDTRFPGWRLAKVHPENMACVNKRSPFSPSIVWGDLNRDEQRDYVLQVVYRGKMMVMAFLSDNTVHTLARFPHDGGNILQIVRRNAGGDDTRTEIDPMEEIQRQLRESRGERTVEARGGDEVVSIVYCEKGRAEFTYGRGRFHEDVID